MWTVVDAWWTTVVDKRLHLLLRVKRLFAEFESNQELTIHFEGETKLLKTRCAALKPGNRCHVALAWVEVNHSIG